MTVLLKLEPRKPDRAPTWLASVHSVEAGLIGHYDNGVPYAPDKTAVREALPACHRRAFDRSSQFWFDTNGDATRTLTPARRKGVPVTILATPCTFEA